MKGQVKTFIDPKISDCDYIQSFSICLNPEENCGEAIILNMALYTNGDEGPDGYWTDISLEANCYGNHCLEFFMGNLAIESLKEAVDKLYIEKIRAEK